MKKVTLFIVVALIMALTFTACTTQTPSEPVMTETDEGDTTAVAADDAVPAEKLVVGTMANQIGVPIWYAYETGMYEEAGLNVEVVLFPTGAPINEAMAAKQLDIAGSGMASVFALAAGDCYWLGDYVRTVDGLGVYVRPDSPILNDKGIVPGYENVYGSADTIRGITVLGALGTSDQFNVTAWAQIFGLTANDYQMLHMERGPAVQAFKAGEGDAIATVPPYNTELEEAGYVEAGNMTDVSGMYIDDGMIGRKDVVENRREEVKIFMEVTYQAVDMLYADSALVKEFALRWYNENGRDYTDELMDEEIEIKDYIGKVEMSKDTYRFGSMMIGMGKFYITDGKIEPELEENIISSMYPELLEEIYGIKLTVFGAD